MSWPCCILYLHILLLFFLYRQVYFCVAMKDSLFFIHKYMRKCIVHLTVFTMNCASDQKNVKLGFVLALMTVKMQFQ